MARLPVGVERHFEAFPQERLPVERFTDLFLLSWVARDHHEGSDVSVYLLKPKPHASETYGLTRELMLLFSPYKELQPRTLQQAEQIAGRQELQGRVEPLYLALIAPSATIQEQAASFRQEAEQTRILIPFSVAELQENRDPWLLRRRFASCLFARDLFDMKQALVNDTYFFGRQSVVLDLLDRFKRGENTGIYGLRKTGKTSALFKLRRLIDADKSGTLVYIDAQSPEINQLRWWELLSRIKDEAAERAGVVLPAPLDKTFTQGTATNRMRQAVEEVLARSKTGTQRLLVVIDEIEHIAAGQGAESHWGDDFVPFWRLLRAIQTEERRLSFLVAGVNAQVSETSVVGAVDNPLFSLLGTRYLPLFTPHETREMVQGLGTRMGLLFAKEACAYLSNHYGGHPMLIRLACSWEHRTRSLDDIHERPLHVTEEDLRGSEAERDNDLLHYAAHVLDVLRLWYPSEYELLSLVASGEEHDLAEYSKELPETVQHLRSYGLLSPVTHTLAIPLLATYLQAERLKAEREAKQVTLSRRAGSSAQPANTAMDIRSLIANGESAKVEFKSTLRANTKTLQNDARIEHACLKTIAAFLNTDGGTLLLGVNDSGVALGLAADAFLTEDKMLLHLGNIIRDRLGAACAPLVGTTFHAVDGKRILAVSCGRGTAPVYLKDGDRDVFYVRLLAATVELGVKEVAGYITTRFRMTP